MTTETGEPPVAPRGSSSFAPATGHEQLVGQRLGRYRISSSLGRGGMAEVFRANDDRLNREVAIKVVLPAFVSEPELMQRFLREAQVVASLEHPNILPIYDFGEHEGLPFLVMPLIRDGTLADRLEAGSLDPRRVATWIHDLAQALDAAHAAGVLHRDVKPGNVLVGRDEHLFLADFGIARLCDATRLTRTGSVVGTPIYMSPEVAAGQPAEAASDLYALAVMTYEMLAGRPPFEGENPLSILHQHATCPVPPISERLDHLPAGVDQALERGLAKSPATRPPTCRAFGELLAGQLSAARPTTSPRVNDQEPTLEMTEDPTAATALPTAVTAVPGSPESSSPALMPLAASDAYTTLHATSGGRLKIRQWGLAGLVGGLVVLAGLQASRELGREPLVTADAVEIDPLMVVHQPLPESLEPTPAARQPATEPPQAEATSVTSAATPPPAVPEAPLLEVPSEPEVSPAPRPVALSGGGSRPGASPPRRSEPTASPDRARPNALRLFSSRLTASDFEKIQQAARRMSDRGPIAGQGVAMETYARGGLAYLDGDQEVAASALREALRNQRLVAFWGPGPLMLLAAAESGRDELEPWELALGYGDPYGTAGKTLDALLSRQPENARLRFARALVHRLDAEHEAVIHRAVPVFQQLGDSDAPEARGYLAQVIGDAYLGLDRGDEALEWFRRSFEIGGLFRGVAAMRGAEAARASRRPDAMAEFLRHACEADVQPACRRLKLQRSDDSTRRSRDQR